MKAIRVTWKSSRTLLLTGVLLTTACDQSISAKVCERQAECNNLKNKTVDECTDSSESKLEGMTDAQRKFIETALEACLDVTCSEFEACYTNQLTGE